MKIGVTKHTFFTLGSITYRTHFLFHMLCSYLVSSGNTLGSEQRDEQTYALEPQRELEVRIGHKVETK